MNVEPECVLLSDDTGIGSSGNNKIRKTNNRVVNKSTGKLSSEYAKYGLTDDKCYKIIIDGVRTFGLVSNKTLGRAIRSKTDCVLCNFSFSGSYNIKIDSDCAVGVCITCIKQIHVMLSQKEVTFEYVQTFLVTRVRDRYKAPILFDDEREMLKEMTPRVTKDGLTSYTYNKQDSTYAKRISLDTHYSNLCDKYRWPYEKPCKKRKLDVKNRRFK